MPLHEEEYKGFRVIVEQDPNPESPRIGFGKQGIMACFHRRYVLGDNLTEEMEGEIEGAITPDSFKEWLKKNKKKIAVSLPLYLLDHSSQTMNTTGFADCDPQGWDWGQVGVIFMTREELRRELQTNRLTKKMLENAKAALVQEVAVYNQFLQGDVFQFRVMDKEGNCHESCCGFYELKYAIQTAKVHAHMIADQPPDPESVIVITEA